MSIAWCEGLKVVVMRRESTGQAKRPAEPGGALVVGRPASAGAWVNEVVKVSAVVDVGAGPPGGASVAPPVDELLAEVTAGVAELERYAPSAQPLRPL